VPQKVGETRCGGDAAPLTTPFGESLDANSTVQGSHRLEGKKPDRTPGKMDKPLQFAGLGTRLRPKKPAPSLL
jgi:hypothetical protein